MEDALNLFVQQGNQKGEIALFMDSFREQDEQDSRKLTS